MAPARVVQEQCSSVAAPRGGVGLVGSKDQRSAAKATIALPTSISGASVSALQYMVASRLAPLMSRHQRC
eukprot:CAMPEP_0115255238 /NCGR_PEP_ID=MMETSP0270-20121206/45611_1 /TAXON_ID=71861 /ORGANISM="Scrippsiella trochoidea, Strain CCMP3099" /LENGTH=69 /DNA_ID=CAMNT_0002670821 /DNA_START=103 /DNA_END=312 /DNA_ORIENTATION=+